MLGIDPGRSKCGLAYVNWAADPIVERSVVPTESLVVTVCRMLRQHPEVEVIVIGSGTGSRTLAKAVHEALPESKIALVDEVGTSVLARQRYLAANPPKGWKKLLPKGLLVPDEPIDDYAALILAERFLAGDHQR